MGSKSSTGTVELMKQLKNNNAERQNFINRQTYQKKILDDDGVAAAVARKESGIGHLGPLSSYELEKLHKRHGAANIDQERRNAAKQSQYLTYSAKIDGRLSSTDYTQQW